MRGCVEAEGAEEEMAPRCENTEVPPSSYIILMRQHSMDAILYYNSVQWYNIYRVIA